MSQQEKAKGVGQYDLEERTAKFGEGIIHLCRSVPLDVITKPIIGQLVACGTSVGANYAEANGASSRKDFRNKIHIVKKEIQESKHFLRMLAAAVPQRKDDIRQQWKEAHELMLIFGKIASSLR